MFHTFVFFGFLISHASRDIISSGRIVLYNKCTTRYLDTGTGGTAVQVQRQCDRILPLEIES